jgi:predicted nucleotidyltransferase
VDRDTILERLNEQSPTFKERYGLRSLAVFGSMARGDDHQGSDVDILATFEGPATFDRYMGLQLELEELLGRPVDLGTPETLRPEIRATVERELIRVA